MLVAAVAYIFQGLALDALFKLRAEKFLICLVGIGRPTVSKIEQRFMLFLATLTMSTASGYCHFELNAVQY
jgi:hypothetical protein